MKIKRFLFISPVIRTGFTPNLSRLGFYFFTFLSLFLIPSSPLFADSKTGADFLKIPLGARAVGLGEAYTALVEGPESLDWNPAGIAKTGSFYRPDTIGLSLSHQELFVENKLDHIALAYPLPQVSFGLNVTRLSYPDQEGRDSDRNKTGSFGTSDLSLGGALAYNFGMAQMGSQLKFIQQELAGEKAQGWALDFGLLTKIPKTPLSFGFAARNLGPQLQFIHEKFNLPLSFSVGTLYQICAPLALSMDLKSQPNQNKMALAFGTEFQAMDMVVLRAGYLAKLAENINPQRKSEINRGNFSGLPGFTAGLGIKFTQFSLDYALAPMGELGDTHSFTFSAWFGRSSGSEKPKKSPDKDRIILQIDPSRSEDPSLDHLKP